MRKQLLFVINRTLFDIHSWGLSRYARHPISGKTYRLSSLSVIMSVPMVPLGQSSFLCLLLPFLSAVKAVLSLFRHKSLLCPQKQQESLSKYFSPLVTENRGGQAALTKQRDATPHHVKTCPILLLQESAGLKLFTTHTIIFRVILN